MTSRSKLALVQERWYDTLMITTWRWPFRGPMR